MHRARDGAMEREGVASVDRAADPSTAADVSDEMLLAGFGVGDATAALAFVRRFQRMAFGVALAVIGDAGLAEDIAQQGFERAWRQFELYDPRRGTVRAWLRDIVHNLAVDTARVHRPYPIDEHDLHRMIGVSTQTPERHALARETATELGNALAGLPDEQARAVVLTAVYGLTARELARLETIPVGTAKSRIRTALTKLHDVTATGRSVR